MKILYIHQYFVEPDAPGSTRSYELARRLVARGHEVDLVTTDWRDDGLTSAPGTDEAQKAPPSTLSRRGWRVREVAGIRVHASRVPYANRMGFFRRVAAFLLFAFRANRYARSLSYDVVIASSTPLTVALPGMGLARHGNVPFVFEVRDLWPDLPVAVGAIRNPVLLSLVRRLEASAYKNASAIIVLSPDMRDALLARGIPSKKISVIPNGCDLDLFRVGNPEVARDAFRARLPEELRARLGDDPLVVYMGSLGRMNDPEYMVRLAAEVRHVNPAVRFAVFGEGVMEARARERARELGILGESFFMFAPIPKLAVPPVLHAADVALSIFADYPEMWANSANKFFDALASGTAVAINYEGWQAELLARYEAGVVLPARDVAAAARILSGLLADADRLKRMGAQARALAEEEFDRDGQAERLAAVLEGVVRSSG